jgi:hypothetical protein
MQRSLYLEATNPSGTQEFLNIFWNPKVYNRVHTNPSLVPILSQINPVHTYFSKIHFYIVACRSADRR